MSDNEQNNNSSEVTFFDHLEEMRTVILRSLLAFVVAVLLVGIFFTYFNDVMLYPLNAAKRIIGNSEMLSGNDSTAENQIGPVYLVGETKDGQTPKTQGPYYIVSKDENNVLLGNQNNWYDSIKLRSMSFTTPIMVWFYVSFLGGLGLSLPVILYFIIQFIMPGLNENEKRLLRPGIIVAIMLFCIGVTFAFAFMLPMGIAFMSYMSESLQMEMFPDAQAYYSMVLFLTIAVGVVFEMPLLQTILIYLGVLNTDWLRKNRRVVFLVILIFATVITPPDFITQISLTIPLYLMYEMALVVGERMRKRKLQREAQQEILEESLDAKEREEYSKMVAKERLSDEQSEESESEENYYNDDYSEDNDYGYDQYYDDFEDEYDQYAPHPKNPPPSFAPNWDLNRVDTSFMTPNWDLNKPKEDDSTTEQTDNPNQDNSSS